MQHCHVPLWSLSDEISQLLAFEEAPVISFKISGSGAWDCGLGAGRRRESYTGQDPHTNLIRLTPAWERNRNATSRFALIDRSALTAMCRSTLPDHSGSIDTQFLSPRFGVQHRWLFFWPH